MQKTNIYFKSDSDNKWKFEMTNIQLSNVHVIIVSIHCIIVNCILKLFRK